MSDIALAIAPVMIDLLGPTLHPSELQGLRDPRVGGVILFSRNFTDCAQLHALVHDIRAARPEPLLIAVDQEGGRVQRFRAGFSALPAAARLGELHAHHPGLAVQAARDLGLVMAWELRDCGLDFSFAPVLDLDHGRSAVIGHRALAADPETVAELAAAVVDGIQAAGSVAIGKHFPGHGYVAADSHIAQPVDERSLDAIEQRDLLPFARLSGRLTGIMPAHVVYPLCAPEPAGFSAFWLRHVLRERLQFQGVIFSDDLSMAGAHAAGGPAQRARAAFAAGCDMVMLCNRPDDLRRMLDELDERDLPVDGGSRRAALYCQKRPTADAGLYAACLERLDTLNLDGWRRADGNGQ